VARFPEKRGGAGDAQPKWPSLTEKKGWSTTGGAEPIFRTKTREGGAALRGTSLKTKERKVWWEEIQAR